MNINEVWLCVDQEGEKMFKGQKPIRWIDTTIIPQEVKLWTATGECGIDYEMTILPKGMIERILGTFLSWESDPILYCESSVFIRTADRQKSYEQVKKVFSQSWDNQEDFLKSLMDESIIKPSRLLDIMSSYIKYYENLLETGGFIKIDRMSHIIEYGKSYACLDKDGKLCKVIAGSENWDEVTYILPKMRASAVDDILIELNPDWLGK